MLIRFETLLRYLRWRTTLATESLSACEQVLDGGSRYRWGRLRQPVERRAAVAVAGAWVCSVLKEHLDGLQETGPGGVVHCCRVEGPDAGRVVRVAGAAVGRAGTVAQEGADVLRVVFPALVS